MRTGGVWLDGLRRRVRALERREVTRQNRLGFYLAVLTCPCHAGWLVVLTAGTAAGAWLAEWSAWLYGLFGAAFAGSLWLLFRRGRSCATCVDAPAVRVEPRVRATGDPSSAPPAP